MKTIVCCVGTSRFVFLLLAQRLRSLTLLQAVLQLNWTAGGDNIWTASADKSVGFWDAVSFPVINITTLCRLKRSFTLLLQVTGQRVRKMADHSNIVNGGLHHRLFIPTILASQSNACVLLQWAPTLAALPWQSVAATMAL
jgi:hypothetical protein